MTNTQMTISKPRTYEGYGSTFYYRGDAASVTWTFDDGVVIHATQQEACTEYPKRGYTRSNWKELEKKARIYVDTQAEFNIVEDLTNRTRRPWQAWKPRVVEALSRIGVEFDHLSWSQSAGCSMCPCSPGFVPRDPRGGDTDGWTFYVTLPGAPVVDERRAPRELFSQN